MYESSEHQVRLELCAMGLEESKISNLIESAKETESVKFTDKCPEMGQYTFVYENGSWKDNVPHYSDYISEVRSVSRVFDDVTCGEIFTVVESLNSQDNNIGKSFKKMGHRGSEVLLVDSNDTQLLVPDSTPWIVSLV
jgi:hypothetical protein